MYIITVVNNARQTLTLIRSQKAMEFALGFWADYDIVVSRLDEKESKSC